MAVRKWRAKDLANLTGLNSGYVSMILLKKRNPGPKACKTLAHALDIPEEEVFRHAGHLPFRPREHPNMEEWDYLFLSANEGDRQFMLDLVRLVSQRSRKE
jgi:transcriptional regulator with XRE-family HTH domain